MIKEKCGIIYKQQFNCQKILQEEEEDEYNITLKFETNKQSFVFVVFYAAPGVGHTDRLNKLINVLIKIKEKYGHNMKAIVYGDLNTKRNKIKKRIENKIKKYEYEILYKECKEEYTFERKILDTVVRSYLDYFIIHGVTDYVFNMLMTNG